MARVAVVTGAAQGIGRACAERLTAAGWRVIAVDLQAADVADARLVDVADPVAVEAFWAGLDAAGIEVDGLVNVVGISGRRYGDGPLHECTDEAFDRLLQVNLRSQFQMTRAALRRMRGRGGSIVNIASVLAFSPSPRHFATHLYAAGKAAVIGLTQSAAAYYAADRVRLNAVAPGLIRTPMAQRADEDPAIREYIAGKQALRGDLGSPEDVAAAVAWLLSDEASLVTGVVLPVDGGWSVIG